MHPGRRFSASRPHLRGAMSPSGSDVIPDDAHTEEHQVQPEPGISLETLVHARQQLDHLLAKLDGLPEQLASAGLFAEAGAALAKQDAARSALGQIDRQIERLTGAEPAPVPIIKQDVTPRLASPDPVPHDDGSDSAARSTPATHGPIPMSPRAVHGEQSVPDARGRGTSKAPLQDVTQTSGTTVSPPKPEPAPPVRQPMGLHELRDDLAAPVPSPGPSISASSDHEVETRPRAVALPSQRRLALGALLAGSMVIVIVALLLVGRFLAGTDESAPPGQSAVVGATEDPGPTDVTGALMGATEPPGSSSQASVATPSPTSASVAVVTTPEPSPTPVATDVPAQPTIAPEPSPESSGNSLTITSTPAPPLVPTIAVTETPTTEQLLERIEASVAGLQRGRIDVEMVQGDQSRSSSTLLFDIEGGGQPMRLHVTTTYESRSGTQVIERIMVGSQAWERQGSASWNAIGNLEGVWGQIQAFLPQTTEAADVEWVDEQGRGALGWYDRARDVDVVIVADPDTGTPVEMQQTVRATGSTVTVIYSAWNEEVTITPPQ